MSSKQFVYVFVHGGLVSGVTDENGLPLEEAVIVDYDNLEEGPECIICFEHIPEPESKCMNCLYDPQADHDGMEAIAAHKRIQARALNKMIADAPVLRVNPNTKQF
jgi:hypothetical protein